MALIQLNFLSACLMRTVTVNAVVPFDKLPVPGAAPAPKRPFKTLYLLHGIFGNYTDWVSGTRVQRWAEAKDLAVIMPSGENHFYVDCAANGERYAEFIGRELPEKMQQLFGLSPRREDNFIAGLSMGGYGAIVTGLRYRERFGCIAGLSSALLLDQMARPDPARPDLASAVFGPRFIETVFGPPAALQGGDKDYYALARKAVEAGGPLPSMYLCCGLDDGLLEANRAYAQFLRRLGIPCTYEEGPGAHEWDFWDTYLKKILDWLPLEAESEGITSGHIG